MDNKYLFDKFRPRKKMSKSEMEIKENELKDIQSKHFSKYGDYITIYNNSFELDFFHCCKDIFWSVSFDFINWIIFLYVSLIFSLDSIN